MATSRHHPAVLVLAISKTLPLSRPDTRFNVLAYCTSQPCTVHVLSCSIALRAAYIPGGKLRAR